ncbi:cytochrome P450 [Amycolatopsis keratiniphila]|uniref:Steroid C27-monooxygenase n=1 Tax=Amycolatopsis keratiniphila subsp. keratiniphila TaxID=227715 RepID=A0A1W2LMT6_9PSEU|nr:cytochrome P450 [Amycolatopsis keratiniphila]OLZ48772.1 steroid C27-monooxygenase [Amycolatopsis keratiniphila subsp. nogabecina]ONF64258.1 steroid C27-monooxygenase [Amycolatopsis keratiniphila subsp. keratiniphila]SDU34380.1 cholest-4-en-3-one 26-monooxygenase [Amycolatopsis keratiniphila]
MAAPLIPAGFDFTDPDLYATRLPLEEFAELRRTAPVWWNPQPHNTAGFRDDGYWVVSRLDDVKAVSRDSELFSSREKTAIIRFDENMTDDSLEANRLVLLNMDAPQHTKLRRIVSKGFTPRSIAKLEDTLRDRAERIVSEAKKKGSGDFVVDVACELPLQAIAELIGIPQEDRLKVFDWSNQMVAYDDPEYEVEPLAASAEIVGYAWNMAEERRKCPMDDIVTKLVQADVDGESLASDEFGFFVILLAVAGNETTRNAITHGMKAFLDHPDQWELYKKERPKTAPDEIVRWATPVVAFQRTATRDTELGGQRIRKGDRVGMFYSSANFDPDHFDQPEKFDILREDNPHVGFGGTGSHYCIGANLARLEIDLIFNAIADVMPDIAELAPPDRLRSSWLNGIKHYQVRYA